MAHVTKTQTQIKNGGDGCIKLCARVRRPTMSKKGSERRTFNVSVVGLSGLDQDQSLYGVGKSCLCNRFVRPLADEYITEHTSVFSTSDFGGRVINNDQFLYWGNARKTTEEGNEIVFQVFEQTEFIDDASLMSLTRGGTLTPYPKRCAASKLSSPEKLMYISRDQVALQNDYEQVTLPAGKLTIDGFIVVYDAEASRAKQLEETQERMLSSVVSYVQKSKKPFVIAVTKCDDTQLNLLQEVHRFAQGKKLSVPIVETSSHENVNVDMAFNVLAQLIERGKIRSKILPFSEAQKTRREMIEKTVQAYLQLINRTARDFRVIWKNTRKAIENEAEFKAHRDLCGLEACKRQFNKHIRKLRKEFEESKLEGYLEKLPKALDELLPTVSSLEVCHWDWMNCQNAIRNHKAFSSTMIVLPEETAWNESDHLTSDDERIPFDILSLPRSEKVFQLHVEKLKDAEKRLRMMNEFRKLLELTPQIHPGAQWLEAVLWLQNEESFLYLKDSDKTNIFDAFSRTITEQAKGAFQELLFEAAALFSKLKPNSRPSLEDMSVIKSALSRDVRYQKLEKLDNVRDILLFNHIALMHSPNRCLSGPAKCRDRLMQEIVSTTTYRPQFMDSNETLDSDDSQLSLLLIGSEGLAQELEREIQLQSSYGDGDTLEYAIDGRMFEMDLRVMDGDVDLPENALTGTYTSPQGCLCVYGSRESLLYIQEYLDSQAKNKFDSIDSDHTIHGPPPTVVILAHNPSDEDNIHFLRKEGQRLASRFEVSFVDVPLAQFGPSKKIHDTQVVDSIRALLEGLKQQSRKTYSMEDIKESEPDLKILLCAMCGDPYPVELILGPLFHHQSSWRSPTHSDTIVLETYLGYEKRKVMITLTSYHRASSLNYQMFHGYILVYSAIRKASLAILSGFSASLPQVPIQVLAVTGSASGASVVFHSNVAASLLADGTNLASKLCAKFQTTSPHFQHQAGAFATFFNNVWENKANSEGAYATFLSEQQLRYTQKKSQQARNRQDPLPELPTGKPKHVKSESLRRRSYNDRTNFSPKSRNRFSESALTDPEMSQYAVVSEEENGNIYEEAHSRNDMQPLAMSTPNVVFVNEVLEKEINSEGAGEVSEKRPAMKEAVYASVIKTKKRLSRKSDDSSMDDSEMNLIENSLYANKNLTQHSQGMESRGSPPPLPQRNYDPREEAAPEANGLSSHAEDEGYSTIPMNHNERTDKHFDTLVVPPRDGSTPQTAKDPSTYDFREKVKLFENEMRYALKGQDVWIKMNLPPTENMRASFPELQQRGVGDVAPLAQQEDVSDPEYAQIQDALKQSLRISNKGGDATAKNSSQSKYSHMAGMNTLRSTHSAEDISTLERKGRNDSFGRPQLGMRTDSTISDWGTGDEASLPRTAEHSSRKKLISMRSRSKEKHWHISRSKSSARKEAKKFSSFLSDFSQDDDSSSLASTLEGQHSRNYLLNISRRSEPGDSDVATEEDTEDDIGSPSRGKIKKKSFLDSRGSRKKPARDGEKAEKQRRKEAKKQKREDEKKAKKMRKLIDQREKNKQRSLVLEKLCTEEQPIPSFFDKCLNFVEASGMQTEGIYRISGNKADIELVDRCFQENPSLEFSDLSVSVHAVTGSLKSFLKQLQEPLIPKDHQDSILEAMVIMEANNRLSRLRTILSNLPACNLVVFKRFMDHLNRVTEFSKENLMESRNLSTVLFPTIIRPNFASLQVIASQMNYGLFIQTCIEKCDFLFDET